MKFCTAVITLFFSLISVQVAKVRTRWWRFLFLIIEESFDALSPGPSLTELDGGQDRWEVVTANHGDARNTIVRFILHFSPLCTYLADQRPTTSPSIRSSPHTAASTRACQFDSVTKERMFDSRAPEQRLRFAAVLSCHCHCQAYHFCSAVRTRSCLSRDRAPTCGL